MIARALQLLLILAMATSGWTVYGRWSALRLFAASGIADLERALEVDPDNPELHFRLALTYGDDSTDHDLNAAAESLDQAIELNPHDWHYHFEQGRLQELLGNLERAEAAYRSGLELSPAGSRYHWRFANFYLRAGDLEAALPEFRTALRDDASLLQPAFSLLRALDVELETVVALWPTDPPSRLRLLRLAQSDAQSGSANGRAILRRLWSSALESDDGIPLPEGSAYVDHLAANDDPEGARLAWIDLMRERHVQDPAFESLENLLWNGDFERPITGAGLGWQVAEIGGIRFEQVGGNCPSSTSCARLAFDDSDNPTRLGLEQSAIVLASHSYSLSFYARTLGVSSDEGPYLDVIDATTGKTLASTEAITGSTPWQRYQEALLVEEGTHRLLLRLRRRKSLRLDNRLSGTLWLDRVVLEKVVLEEVAR